MLQVYKGGVDGNLQTTMGTFRRHILVDTRLPARTLGVLAAAAFLICGSGATAGSGETAGQPVASVIANVLDAWDRVDAHAIAAQYETNGDFVSPDGMHAEGRREIESFYRGAFAQGYAGSHATATVAYVRSLSATLTLVDGSWTIQPTPASKVRQPEAGLFFAVLHRHGGRWRIAALREQSSARTLRALRAHKHRPRSPSSASSG